MTAPAPARPAITGRHTGRSRGAVIVTEPGTWRERAACPGEHDPSLWDLARSGEHHRARDARHDLAISVCRGCPVRAQCGADAAANEEAGVWGGRIRVPDWYPSRENLRSHRTVPPAR